MYEMCRAGTWSHHCRSSHLPHDHKLFDYGFISLSKNVFRTLHFRTGCSSYQYSVNSQCSRTKWRWCLLWEGGWRFHLLHDRPRLRPTVVVAPSSVVRWEFLTPLSSCSSVFLFRLVDTLFGVVGKGGIWWLMGDPSVPGALWSSEVFRSRRSGRFLPIPHSPIDWPSTGQKALSMKIGGLFLKLKERRKVLFKEAAFWEAG